MKKQKKKIHPADKVLFLIIIIIWLDVEFFHFF